MRSISFAKLTAAKQIAAQHGVQPIVPVMPPLPENELRYIAADC
jgi:hypothetical protein